jgi:hypothetical protein
LVDGRLWAAKIAFRQQIAVSCDADPSFDTPHARRADWEETLPAEEVS